ncbi:hypothetical protein GZH53_05615 [Flavihumibacter sp. R14]|nr:hypothetical protein [Flavihumibacter soli]
MKNLIVIFLLLTGLSSFGQSGWKTVKLDTAISFQLPKGFQKTKSDSASSFSAATGFGTILIFKADDNQRVTPDIERDKHLADFYDDYIKRVESSTADGKITHERDTLIGGLKVKDFTLELDSGGGVQVRKFRILHANSATYTFEFLFEEMHKEYAAEECNKFFNSIKVNESVEHSDQFNATASENSGINPYLIGAVVLLIIGLIIFFIVRKKRVVS